MDIFSHFYAHFKDIDSQEYNVGNIWKPVTAFSIL